MKFPSHLNCDGKIVSEMGPRPILIDVDTVLWFFQLYPPSPAKILYMDLLPDT